MLPRHVPTSSTCTTTGSSSINEELRYALLDLPLETIHPLAFRAAEAAHCAGEQGKYWGMHDRLFANQRALEPWSGHAQAVGLDVADFDAYMTSGNHADAVRRDMIEARKAGATGAASCVLARPDPSDPRR